METSKIKLRQQVLIPLAAILAILTTIVVYTEQKVEYGRLRNQHLTNLHRVGWLLDKKFDDTAAVYEILTQQLCRDTSLQRDFLAGDRDKLLADAEARYQTFHHDYGVTHFYFHQPDKTCFLRLHQPSRFGDVIDRHTLATAIRQDKPFYGVELGPLGTLTLRYVRPWRADGKLIGYVEMGCEIDGIREEIKDEMGLDLAVLVEKQFLDHDDWQAGLKAVGRTENWDLLKGSVVAGKTLGEFPESCIDYIQQNCLLKTNCYDTPVFELEGKTYIVGHFVLMDAGAVRIGRVFVFSDITEPAAVIAQSSLFFGAMCLAAGVLMGIFLYFYIGQIERRLRETHTQQKIEIMHRRFAEAQLREAKDRAEAANLAKSRFMANMSHELRTPMNAIIGFNELLKDEMLTDEQLDYVETIHNSSAHLLTLINDVLDISKIEAGKLEITTEPCSLKRLLDQVDGMMRQAAEAKRLTFRIELDDMLPAEIITDAKHLYQCLINLVGNSVKFTSRGHVIIRASALRDTTVSYVRFEVEDTGIGIPKDKQKIVFESFQQADTSTSRKYGGTGLGLSISRQLIELMGGTLTLSSEEGQGSTFTIMLPYECPENSQQSAVNSQ
ncbi:MAG: ATP-binding protein [Phycisphaerae bacterium]|nr:ATP-binding protein [Phycisphaerae bacterium]